MEILAQAVGLLIAACGLAILIQPQLTHKVFEFIKQGHRIYIAGVVRVCVGLVLFLSSSGSDIPMAANMLGAIFLLSGVIVFVSDLEKLKAFMAKYNELPEVTLRLLGLLAAAFGLLTFSLF